MEYIDTSFFNFALKPVGKIKPLGKKDYEFYFLIKDILENEIVKSSDTIMHHYKTSCYRHMFNVSYYSYKICKFLKLDYASAARGAMLHDLYLYNWHRDSGIIIEVFKKHPWMHPKIALLNAKSIFKLNKKEKDIIANHMWPVTYRFPRYIETYVIGVADKLCWFLEVIRDIFKK